MKKAPRFVALFLLPLILLMGSVGALATDTGRDGIPDMSVFRVSAGAFHNCALNSTTGVHCWGDDVEGQTTKVPVLVNPVEISAGYDHTCALDNSGVHCWGDNFFGQTTIPVLVNPVAVSAGYDHTCALDNSGVHCWGKNDDGQSTVPVLVNPVAVSAGIYYTCAIDDAGVHCWGNNNHDQTTVPALVNPVAVSAGSIHTCAIDDAGVHCWGYNSHGQTTVPVLVNPVAVSVGGSHTCAIDDAGVHCWGNNFFGQSTVPALVNPVAVSAGALHTCALDNSGVHCWGDNTEGQTTVPTLAGGYLNSLGGIKNNKAGASVAFAGDFNGDGYGDYVIGIPGFDLSKKIKDAGRAEVISGKDGSMLKFVNGVAAKDAMGTAVAGNADLNNDGFDDVVIGAPKADDLSNPDKKIVDTGTVTVVYGRADINPVIYYDHVLYMGMYGATKSSFSGSALALGNVDDENYEGNADIIIGAPMDDDIDNGLQDAGSVVVLNGYGYNSFFKLYGSIQKAHAGASVAVGDYDNNGYANVIVGAPNDDDVTNGFKDSGSVTVYDQGAVALMKKYGAMQNALLGKSVAAGHINNDAFVDVLAGSPGDDNGSLKDAGSVTVFFPDATPSVTKYGAVAKAGLGNSVAAGDVNGDGYADIIAGASKDDKPTIPKVTKNTGSVSIWSGTDYALINTVYGDAANDYFGTAVSAGDINSDGKADLMIGIPGFELPATSTTKTIKDAGAVLVLSGAGL